MKVLKESDDELEILFENEKPTFLLLLKEELDKNENIIIAAWREDHPLTKNIYFYVKTNGKIKAREALLKAIENSLKRLDNFEKELKKVL